MVFIRIEQTSDNMVARANKNKLALHIRELCRSHFKCLDNDYDTILVLCDKFQWTEFYYSKLKWYEERYPALMVIEHLQSVGARKLGVLCANA